MKNFIIALLVLVGITQFTPTQISAIESGSNDAAYYEAKKLEAQSASTKMRLEYYQKYKAKGYDMSLMTSDFLDASKTSESSFWEMLKKIQNTHEMVGRKEYVEKLRSKGIDVSGFTETVMNDSGKFWELFNSLYKSYQSGQDKEYKEKKDSEEKKQYEEKKLLEQKKYLEEKQRLEEEKKNKQAKSTTQERFKKLFIARLDTVPTEKRSDIYPRLEKNIIKALDLAKTKSNTTLIEKLSWMLSTLREKMNQDDDEAIIEDLFRL